MYIRGKDNIFNCITVVSIYNLVCQELKTQFQNQSTSSNKLLERAVMHPGNDRKNDKKEIALEVRWA